MKIKTGRIRRKFDEAIQNGIISANMLLMALSALNNEICYNDKLTNKQVAVYQNYRSTIAKTAIDNGISKDRITEVMQTLSPERYPSPQQITQLITLIENRSYSYKADYIPDSDMKYKTATEIQDTNSQPVIQRNQDSIESEHQFNEICEIISGNYDITITADMQSKIRTIKESNDIILQVLKWYTNDIYKAISKKQFDSSYDKFNYIIGIVVKKIPDTVSELERRKKKQNEFWNDNATAIIDGDITLEEMIALHCDDDRSANYGKHDYVRDQLLQAIERLKEKR